MTTLTRVEGPAGLPQFASTHFRALGLLAALALLGAVPQAVRAQTPAAESPEQTKAVLEAKQKELEQAQKRKKLLQSDVEAIRTERERVNIRLVETAGLIQKSEARLTSTEAKLAELELQEQQARRTLGQRHGQISKLLAALQRMGRNPPPVMITRREDALEMVRSAMLVAQALPELRDQALKLASQLNKLVDVMNGIRTEREAIRAETDRLNDARTRLSGLLQEKKLSLAERRAELEQVRSTEAEMAKSVTDLSELITKLDKTVAENTELARYEAELKSEPPPALPPAVPGLSTAPAESAKAAPDAAGPTPQDKGKAPQDKDPSGQAVAVVVPPKDTDVTILQPTSAALVPGNPDRIKPAIPFQQAKARLPQPVQGRRVLAFGEKTQFGGQSKGDVFETRANAQITSPADGWVVFAREYRSYGQLLIINAGGGYHVILAGMSQLDVQPGQFVLAGEPVGTMGGVTSTNNGQDNAPVLYVEFRKDGRPIDPDPWWVGKVQG